MMSTLQLMSLLVPLYATAATLAFQTPPAPSFSNWRHRAGTSPSLHQKPTTTSTVQMAKISQNDKKSHPVALVGCSGAGKEIYRLASSLATSLAEGRNTPSAAARDVLRQLEKSPANNNGYSSGGDGFGNVDDDGDDESSETGVVEVIHNDDNGPFVMSPVDLEKLILQKTLSDRDVIVLDYSHALFTWEKGRYKNQLLQAFDSLVKVVAKHCHTIYVNVHPELGLMTPTSREIKQALEKNLFVKYSDYELAVKDEGLDPLTRLALESLDSSQDGGGAGGDKDRSTFEGILRDLTPEEYMAQTVNWDHIQWEIKRIVARARLPHPIVGSPSAKSLLGGRDTFFLSLSFPEIGEALLPYVKSLCEENDAMEFRADLLSCRDDRFEVLYSLQSLRKYCRDHAVRAPGLAFCTEMMDDVLPVVYTIRTQNQAGSWPDNSREDVEKMFSLLNLGLRHGVEVLDVESNWDDDLTDELLTRSEDYATCILGSFHLLQPTSTERAVQLFQQCALSGRAHGAKLVLTIDDNAHDHMAIRASDAAQLDIPTVSLILGESGQYSRILNRNFTPTTHRVLPHVAAPGQLSAQDIMERRLSDGLLRKLKFVSLGDAEGGVMATVEHMHEAAWAACGIPHKFVHRYSNVDEMCNSEVFSSEDFGGGSVYDATCQRLLMDKVHVLTEEAKAIGYVDTLSQQSGVVGDNTDWKGLYVSIKRLLDTDTDDEGNHDNKFALLLGSSGTNSDRAAAYAIKQLGLNVIYYHDTDVSCENGAHENMMKEKYAAVILKDLTSPSEWNDKLGNGKLKVIISTLSSQSEPQIQPQLLKQKPIVCEMTETANYSPLLLQAESSGCDVIRGTEVMWEKGVAQFETWMGRSAPYKVMKTVVLDECLHKEQNDLDLEENVGGSGKRILGQRTGNKFGLDTNL